MNHKNHKTSAPHPGQDARRDSKKSLRKTNPDRK